MKKLLWHSVAPFVETGYGTQTATFAPMLRDELGYDVALSCYFGVQGAAMEWGGMKLYPSDGVWGNRMLGPYAADHAGTGNPADCLTITLTDVWVLTAPQMAALSLASWVPVDHDPVPPRVADFFRKSGSIPIAMSQFGQEKLADAGLDPLYVPHGIDTDTFAPVEGRDLIRQMMGVPTDAFVVGMVANNQGTQPPRKAFPQAFEAFKRLLDKQPDAILYLHCEKFGVRDGVNLVALLDFIGIPESAVRWAPQFEMEVGIPQSAMAQIYSTMDVLMCPSYGEGFGIPIVEAQACGVPVIVGDWTAMPELCGAGWTVEGERWYNAPQGSFWRVPGIGEIAEALEAAYDGAAGLREHARKFALRYDARLVLDEFWRPTLAEIERRLDGERVLPAATLERVG